MWLLSEDGYPSWLSVLDLKLILYKLNYCCFLCCSAFVFICARVFAYDRFARMISSSEFGVGKEVCGAVIGQYGEWNVAAILVFSLYLVPKLEDPWSFPLSYSDSE